ncbi:phenol hydroxylase subunit [Aromatoleum diolicum]|uniref:Phenol hydroxylase n=1 Tax=Aromatoleum diolicum TaxID=75796 RepID=A0ABX1Q4X7_9RHOO|nr:phenol hydroxylase subunit [Aromatoleum diolicum]NMG73419.1 phenol hydroxylase [Aromatoleum diolicum]
MSDLRAPAGFDTTRRFVRVTGERSSGFVEFDFAVGEPELAVEMILPREAFAEFCERNAVEILPPVAEADSTDASTDDSKEPSDWDWRLADATRTRFR